MSKVVKLKIGQTKRFKPKEFGIEKNSIVYHSIKLDITQGLFKKKYKASAHRSEPKLTSIPGPSGRVPISYQHTEKVELNVVKSAAFSNTVLLVYQGSLLYHFNLSNSNFRMATDYKELIPNCTGVPSKKEIKQAADLVVERIAQQAIVNKDLERWLRR